jgi:hypothetical protein
MKSWIGWLVRGGGVESHSWDVVHMSRIPLLPPLPIFDWGVLPIEFTDFDGGVRLSRSALTPASLFLVLGFMKPGFFSFAQQNLSLQARGLSCSGFCVWDLGGFHIRIWDPGCHERCNH